MTLEDFLSTPESRNEAQEFVEQTEMALLMALSNKQERLTDYSFGVRNVTNKQMIENIEFDINQDDIIYSGVKVFKRTPDLYELMFMNYPDANVYVKTMWKRICLYCHTNTITYPALQLKVVKVTSTRR